jgi:hypothetical protein
LESGTTYEFDKINGQTYWIIAIPSDTSSSNELSFISFIDGEKTSNPITFMGSENIALMAIVLTLGIIMVLTLLCCYIYVICKNSKTEGNSVNPFARNDIHEYEHNKKGVGVGDEYAFMEGYLNEMEKGKVVYQPKKDEMDSDRAVDLINEKDLKVIDPLYNPTKGSTLSPLKKFEKEPEATFEPPTLPQQSQSPNMQKTKPSSQQAKYTLKSIVSNLFVNNPISP